jgi:hypothetical protein
MKKNVLLIAFMIVVCGIYSCKKTEVKPSETIANAVNNNTATTANQTYTPVDLGLVGTGTCTPVEVTLIAGQTINSGTVTVTNDANFIYVTYSTANGWLLTQTHLYVGDCALIPVNNPGNPIPGQFPYSGTHNNITSYTYQIPISKIPAGVCGCIAAHAVVVKVNGANQITDQQTAWGNGTRINLSGGNWGMKFEYCSCTP